MQKTFKYFLAMSFIFVVYAIGFIVLMKHENHSENADAITALYWVIVTMGTIGYGDIVFQSPIGRLFSTLVGLTGIVILSAVVLPIVITPWFERLTRELPSSAPPEMSQHIIICGYNPTVETLTEKLSRLKVPFLIIERSEEVAWSIYRKYPTIWGDPSERGVLINANIGYARLLIANERDEANANIVLTVREISDIEVIALVEDLGKSRFLSYAGASRILSPKTLLGTFIARITSPPKAGVFPGEVHLFGDVRLVELPIHHQSTLIDKTLAEVDLRSATGANIVGIWQKGRYVPSPDPDEVIRSHSVLIAVGDTEALTRLRGLTMGMQKKGPTVVIGYGDVGRRIVKVFLDEGVEPIVVDQRDIADPSIKHIVGNGTSEAVQRDALVPDAVAILVMLNDDNDVVFATLVSRNLNPDAFIVARANRVRYAERIYRAGADYVASVPIIASHMLARIAQSEEEDVAMIYEELELKKIQVKKKSPLAGKSIEKLDLTRRYGCTIIAIARDGEVITNIDPDTEILREDLLQVIGGPEGIEGFEDEYGKRFSLGPI